MSTTEDIPLFVLTVLCAVSFILNGTFLIVICKNWTLVKRRRITYHVTSLVLVITITPTLLAIVIRESCKLLNCKFIGTMKTIVTYSKILAMLNFIVNPILYAWRINLYRQAFWKMLGRGIEMRTNNYVVSYSVQDNGDFV